MKEEISAFIFPQSYFTKGHKASRVGLPSSRCGILKMSLIWTWCARAHLSARHWCGRHGGSGSQGHPWLQTESHPSWNTYILSQKNRNKGGGGGWREGGRGEQQKGKIVYPPPHQLLVIYGNYHSKIATVREKLNIQSNINS